MNTIILYIGLLGYAVACQAPQETTQQGNAITEQPETVTEAAVAKATVYGATLADEKAAVAAEQAPHLLQKKDSLYLTLKGTALSSCSKKGCWMTVGLANGESMRITFKDYGFFVPKNLNGEEVVVEGVLSRKISSVDEQRHYAEDAGKSPTEIAAIQQPDTVYAFEAVGVLIYPTTQN